jgi:hypothetical protein
MTTVHLVPDTVTARYEVREWRNAAAVLKEACPDEWDGVISALGAFTLYRSEIATAGGRKSPIASRIDTHLTSNGWVEKAFDTHIVVDGVPTDSPTHKVDCFKNRVALEVEWNNKDPFYDRDLNNFRLLFDLRVIDVGIIITRCSELQTIFDDLGKGKSYGNSTTHMSKLLPRIEGGGGGGCPILAFGINNACYTDDVDDSTSYTSAAAGAAGDVAEAADAGELLFGDAEEEFDF